MFLEGAVAFRAKGPYRSGRIPNTCVSNGHAAGLETTVYSVRLYDFFSFQGGHERVVTSHAFRTRGASVFLIQAMMTQAFSDFSLTAGRVIHCSMKPDP